MVKTYNESHYNSTNGRETWKTRRFLQQGSGWEAQTQRSRIQGVRTFSLSCLPSILHQHFFYRKKAVVKEKIEMKPSNEDAAAGRVSNLQVHKCQQVWRRIIYIYWSNVSFNQLIRIFWLQHYRVIQTPNGNQTVALKSTSREKDLDNRVKPKSDRFCMHTWDGTATVTITKTVRTWLNRTCRCYIRQLWAITFFKWLNVIRAFLGACHCPPKSLLLGSDADRGAVFSLMLVTSSFFLDCIIDRENVCWWASTSKQDFCLDFCLAQGSLVQTPQIA